MIEQQITLCSNGRAVLSGYSGGLLLGYAHNTGVYRLRVVCSGEWDGTTVVAFWHLPGPAGPLTTLVANGTVEVPPSSLHRAAAEPSPLKAPTAPAP